MVYCIFTDRKLNRVPKIPKYVTTLILSINNIKDINEDELPQKLTELVLSFNKIEKISINVLPYTLKNIRFIT